MFDRLKAELGFPFVRCGIVVAALHEDEMRAVEQLYAQGVENGAIGIEMCSAERMLELEPKLSRDALGGLYAPGGGIVEPYRFVFSLVESAVKNGAPAPHGLGGRVGRARGRAPGSSAPRTAGRSARATRSIAPASSPTSVSRTFGAEDYAIKGRKGEYYLLDKLTRAKPEPRGLPRAYLRVQGHARRADGGGHRPHRPHGQRDRGQGGRGHDA